MEDEFLLGDARASRSHPVCAPPLGKRTALLGPWHQGLGAPAGTLRPLCCAPPGECRVPSWALAVGGKEARHLCLSRRIPSVSGLRLISPKVQWHLRATLLDFVHTPVPPWILCAYIVEAALFWGMKGSSDTQVH